MNRVGSGGKAAALAAQDPIESRHEELPQARGLFGGRVAKAS